MRTYGEISLSEKKTKWKLDSLEPHVCIKLKSIFQGVAKYQTNPFYFDNTIVNCADLFWFTQRYNLEISESDLKALKREKKKFYDRNNSLEEMLNPDYVPTELKLKDGESARDYQTKFSELNLKVKRILCGDELGLGKTVTAIITMLPNKTLPAFVVVQSHMPNHWVEKIEQFTNLKIHVIKKRKAYSLPSSDVYIIKYSCLQGWVDVFASFRYRFTIFDEIQELRRTDSNKYRAAKVLSKYSEYVLGLSATPIYNYG